MGNGRALFTVFSRLNRPTCLQGTELGVFLMYPLGLCKVAVAFKSEGGSWMSGYPTFPSFLSRAEVKSLFLEDSKEVNAAPGSFCQLLPVLSGLKINLIS